MFIVYTFKQEVSELTNNNNRSKKLIQIIIIIIIIYLVQQMSAAKIWYASGTLVIITCVYRKNGRYVLKTIFSSFFLIRLIQCSTKIYILYRYIMYCVCARRYMRINRIIISSTYDVILTMFIFFNLITHLLYYTYVILLTIYIYTNYTNDACAQNA